MSGGRLVLASLACLLVIAGCAAQVYVCQSATMNGRPIVVCVPVDARAPASSLP